MASNGGNDLQLRYRSEALGALSGQPPVWGAIRSISTKVLASRSFDANHDNSTSSRSEIKAPLLQYLLHRHASMPLQQLQTHLTKGLETLE